ncbi:hypothetical protein EV702DRAFT_1050288 [Suillus placidus]|uniref:Uncharacterized protein n=1 Tax=Suillus placidus TaxID=48579 RepID=A0A9P6ZIX1_9AGAM|nr:hypothetical protein EV702DRAFT_1050288 [Suillus placidus]
MGPPISIGNNIPPSPSVIIEDIHNMGPWSAGLSYTGYYVGRVAHIIQNLSLKGLVRKHESAGIGVPLYRLNLDNSILLIEACLEDKSHRSTEMRNKPPLWLVVYQQIKLEVPSQLLLVFPMSFRVGYLYTPATSTHGAVILDWQFTIGTIEGSFFKVTHVLPMFAQTLGSKTIYEPIYLDLGEHPKISPAQLSIPTSWRKVYMSDNKVGPAEQEGSIFQLDAGTSFDDSDFLLVLNDWIDSDQLALGATCPAPAIGSSMMMSPDSPGPQVAEAELLSKVFTEEDIPLSNHPATPRFITFLLTPRVNITTNASNCQGCYVPCATDVFKVGITYDSTFIEKHFPFAYICIQDARALAKNYLTTCGMDKDLFFVASERDKVKKSLKDNTLPLIDSKEKLPLEGFFLNGMSDNQVLPYISGMTGLTAWNGINLYRRKAILVLLAYRILKPLLYHNSKRSLLDLFPEHYQSLPEHYIAMREACVQLALLREARHGDSTVAIELNWWIDTRHGVNGWQHELLSAFY